MVRIVAKKVLWRLSHKRPMLLFEERYHLFRQTSEAGNTATEVVAAARRLAGAVRSTVGRVPAGRWSRWNAEDSDGVTMDLWTCGPVDLWAFQCVGPQPSMLTV